MISDLAFLLVGFVVVAFCLFACFLLLLFFSCFFSDGAANTAVKGLIVKGK